MDSNSFCICPKIVLVLKTIKQIPNKDQNQYTRIHNNYNNNNNNNNHNNNNNNNKLFPKY